MSLIKTTTGSNWDTNKTAFSNLLTTIDESNTNKTRMMKLSVFGIAGTHKEFMEEKTDLLVRDEYGDIHEICEDFVWQH